MKSTCLYWILKSRNGQRKWLYLKNQKAKLEEHNATIREVNKKYFDQLENIERKISVAYENRNEADKQADQAKKKAAQYEKQLTEIAPMVKEMERFAEKYSADPEEVLPEAGTLETGKSYREKKAKPLIKKIVTVCCGQFIGLISIFP